MDIKHIIKEEIDEFDWIRNSNPLSILDPKKKYKVWFGRISKEEQDKILDVFKNGGFKIPSDDIRISSLFIEVDDNHRRYPEWSGYLGWMGCRLPGSKLVSEDDVCVNIDGNMTLQDQRLEDDRKYYEHKDSIEITNLFKV